MNIPNLITWSLCEGLLGATLRMWPLMGRVDVGCNLGFRVRRPGIQAGEE